MNLEILDTDEKSMWRIKNLSGNLLHTAVYTVHKHEAVQIFVKEYKGIAACVRRWPATAISHLQKQCQCDVDDSYHEEMFYRVVLVGHGDKELPGVWTIQELLHC